MFLHQEFLLIRCVKCGHFQHIRNINKETTKPVFEPLKWLGVSRVGDWWTYIKQKTIKPKVPRWLSKAQGLTRQEINDITKKHFAELHYADGEFVVIRKIDELFQHLCKYPDAKQYAVKVGCVEKLLQLRQSSNSERLSQQTRMTLSALGYADPPKSRGVRILSIDGGGMRGLAVIQMLKEIEAHTKQKIIDSFDLVCGVSTGAIILGCMLPPNSMPLNKIESLYNDFSSKVFKQNTVIGTGRLLWSHGYYDTTIWEDLLKSHVGKTTMIETAKYRTCPKVFAVSSISVQSRVAPFIFRNYGNTGGTDLEYYGTYKATVFETIRASSAAPTIFEEIRINGIPHMDGGIVLNNPTALAIHEAKNLWPHEEISCLVSCGTGLHDPIFTIEDLKELSQHSTSWKAILDKILASATDTEAVHAALNNLLVGNIYFRLNPPLSKYIVMDEVDKKNLSTLIEDTKMYCRRNKELFSNLAHQLMLPRTKIQQSRDYVKQSYKILKSRLNDDYKHIN